MQRKITNRYLSVSQICTALFILNLGAYQAFAADRPQEAAITAAVKPYQSEDVRFDNPEAGIKLAGTFSTPIGKGPFAAVILLAGSGPNNRDEEPLGFNETSNGHRKFFVLADALNRAGIAVLRYDKRGIGESTGDYASASLSDYVSDANAALHYLQSRPEILTQRIGLVGDSEGAYMAPMLVTQDPGFHYMVLLSAPALPFVEVNLLQKAAIAHSVGASEADIAANDALYRQIFAVVLASATPEEARTALTEMSRPVIASGRFTQAEADAGINGLTSPLGFELMHYDPQPYLAQITIPVLAISGALDTQATPKENLPALKHALTAATDVTIFELPGLNHQLQAATTGAPSEYAAIAETINPSVLTLISDWIVAHTEMPMQ